ncbi:unnamed protein product [Parnassius mnemosyne]|uniref:MADF domain-containing protein n=1 Tax=Parnassius mnemosyne TaxID=213953 RepID=A0AAV1LAL9_9NEOP
MADLRKYSRAFVTEFIELYRELPSLWMVKSKDYSNRDLKSQSYEILVGKFKEVEPNADRDFVLKKIKNMRDVWRRQHEKIEKSLKSGMAVEDIPTPSLWYYDLLNFLKDQETTRSSITNIKIGNKDRGPVDEELGINRNEDVDSDTFSESTQSPAPSTVSTTASRDSNKKKKRPREDILSKINAHLSEPIPTDRWEHTAKSWAGILKSLPNDQQIFAEKLINNVLFEARMNSLSRQSRIDVNHNVNIQLLSKNENVQSAHNSNATTDDTFSQSLLIDPVSGQLIHVPQETYNQSLEIAETRLLNSKTSQKLTMYFNNFQP